MSSISRKPTRLKDYDYSSSGCYFVTICTKNKRHIFWKDVGTTIGRPHELSDIGRIVDAGIRNISEHYPSVSIEKYVVMPNHIHLLIHLCCNEDGRPMVVPTISTIIQQFKGYVSKQIGHTIWQPSFYDHIIRGQADYDKIWEYIENNPSKWEEDIFFKS